ncbi:MAG: dTDP-4-dehydrorhamnose reductase [Thermodesulfobacteriota bacterium]
MKVLLTGAAGQLGWEMQRTVPQGVTLLAMDSAGLDITDAAAVRSLVAEERPRVIVNAAARTAVDRAESEPERARLVNGLGAANLAEAAREQDAFLVQLSTDFVFDGKSSRPYGPADTPAPLGVYGASKLDGEVAVQRISGERSAIVRTSWLYSSHGHNFVKTMLRLMEERNEVRVVADQIGTPTWAGGLAAAVWQIAGRTLPGIHHWSDGGVASWYDFAVAIQEEGMSLGLLGRAIPVLPITTAEYPAQARRPSYSVLDKTATWALLGGPAPHWRVQLRRMLHEYRGQRDEAKWQQGS